MGPATEPEQELLELVTAYVETDVLPAAAEHEASGRFPLERFRALGRMDLVGLPLPEDVGGSGLGYRTYLGVVEQLARGHATLGLAVSVHTLAMSAIDAHGTSEQRRALLPDLVAGRALAAYCLSEPDAGSDAASLTTRGERDGDVYRLTGTKAWVTHGGVADRYVVFARTGGEGPEGISAFVVDADQPGMSVAKTEDKMGLRGSPTAQLRFDGAPVPVDRLIADEGRGFRIAMSALDGGRLGIAAIATGLAQAAFEAALAYAGEREQFGQPIIEFQAVKFLLADMATSIEAARALYREAASQRDEAKASSGRGADRVRELCSMAKLFCTDVAMDVTTDAVQIFGGVGYTRDFPVERYMREAKVMQIFEGTNQIQRLVIGRHLSKGR